MLREASGRGGRGNSKGKGSLVGVNGPAPVECVAGGLPRVANRLINKLLGMQSPAWSGTICAQRNIRQGFVEAGPATVSLFFESHGQCRLADCSQFAAKSSQRTIHPGNGLVASPPVAQLLCYWQPRGVGVRTVATAPPMTGLPLNGINRLDLPLRGCSSGSYGRGFGTGTFAAARELSVGSHRVTTPRILSAIREQNHRQVLPGLASGGGEPVLQASRTMRTSLRPARTKPPQLGNQSTFHRTQAALPGATGVDSRMGAAIHRPVAPGESTYSAFCFLTLRDTLLQDSQIE